MTKFPVMDVAGLLGFTPISTITDQQVWDIAVTPQVKALLGQILEGSYFVSETVKGLFEGDEVSNQNDHRLYGGQPGYVRFPYIYSKYRTTYGLFIVKRDGIKLEAFGWFGNPDKAKPEMIFQFGLRDRRFDATKRVNDSPLVHYPYDDPKWNALLAVDGKPLELSSLETSLYSFFPGSRIGSTCGDKELESFVGSPYKYVDRPELFLKLFAQAWQSDRFPGQIGAVFPDSGKLVHKAFDKLALAAGYDMLETCPSHLHVLRWNMNDGYYITRPEHRRAHADIESAIARMKSRGVKLTRQQESWICVLQSLPRKYISDEYFMGGVRWMQDNIGAENLWLFKPLSEKSKKDLLPLMPK